MKIAKQLVSLFIAVCIIAVGLPLSSSATEIVSSGYCGGEGDGTSLTWTLNDEGTLTISGEQEMTNYGYGTSPWDSYHSSILSVVIEDGVMSIGNFAFYGCSNLTSITISDSVRSIGNQAFFGCASLTSLSIPDSVTNIGNYAFGGCRSLTSVEVAGNNENYSSQDGVVFDKDKKLLIYYPERKERAAYSIPNGVSSIGDHAFEHCSRLTSITIPSSVTSIGEWTFCECSNLTSITIPDSVTSIGHATFESCFSLTSVSIGDSVTSIGEAAFGQCSSLTSITIPNSVTSIGKMAFARCSSLTSITIPSSVTNIGNSAFENCSRLTRITIPNSVTSIGEWTFAECSSLTSITIPDSVMSIGNFAFHRCSRLTGITIPDSVKSIGNQAFEDCSSLTSITIPDSVTSIGETAFSRCSGLTNVIIGNKVTDIGAIAFADCSNLTSITIGDSVTSIGVGAFSGCPSLTSITIPDSVTSIGEWAFKGCKALQSASVSAGMATINAEVFSDCSGLRTINIPASISAIDQNAFSNCSSLADVYYSGTKEQWKAIGVATGNDALTSATIHCSDGIYGEIEKGAIEFFGVFKPVTVEIPYGRSMIASVTIPNAGTMTEKDVTWKISGTDAAEITLTQFFVDGGVGYAAATIQGNGSGEGTLTVITTDGRTASRKLLLGGYTPSPTPIPTPTPTPTPTPEPSSQKSGFARERDGWCLTNAGPSFGYGDNYHISPQRYYEVYGVSLSSLFTSLGSIPEWNGSCFGLSILAVANYNHQIDLSSLFSRSGSYLYDYGYTHISSSDDGEFFSVSADTNAVHMIEKAQISQKSLEIKRAEVFKNDSHFTELINYLNTNNPAPIIVGMNAEHAVVIDTSVKPLETEENSGVYIITLYDSNSPASSSKLGTPKWWYNQTGSFLVVDTNNGNWQYWRNDKREYYFTYYTLGFIQNIEFYDTRLLSDTFFTTPLSLWGNLVKVDFSSSDISFEDEDGNTLFKVEDNDIVYMDSDCEFVPYYSGIETRDMLQGTITIPDHNFSYTSNKSGVSVFSNSLLCAVDNEGRATVAFNIDDASLSFTAENDSNCAFSIQEGTTLDTYSTVQGEFSLKQGNSLNVEKHEEGNLEISGSNEDSSISLKFESTNYTPTEFTDISIGDITSIDYFLGKVEINTTGVRLSRNTLELVVGENETLSAYIDPTSATNKSVSWSSNTPSVARVDEHGVIEAVGAGTAIITATTEDGGFTASCVVTVTDDAGQKPTPTPTPTPVPSGPVTPPVTPVTPSPEPTEEPSPEPTEEPAPEINFTDVADDAYYADAVKWAVARGITVGTSATTFSPNADCTRGQIVTFLWRAAGSPEPASTSNPFTDIKSTDYFYKAVLWAVENNITYGTSATSFSPGAPCTRAQSVTFLWRAEKNPTSATDSDFADVSDGQYYTQAVAWAVEHDITKGTGNNKFSPENTCTRGQIVTFLYRDMGD